MKARLTKKALCPENAGPLCREAFPIGGEPELPVSVIGWFDGRNSLRRVRAIYASGWVLSFGITRRKGGAYPSNVQARLRLKTTASGVPA